MSHITIRKQAPDYNGPDHTTERGAQSIAHRICRYWRERGNKERGEPYTVNAVVKQHPFATQMRRAWFSVETDMLNGWPRDHPKCSPRQR